MVFKPEPRNAGDLRNDWLKRKWKISAPQVASSWEQTRKQLLEMLLPKWNDLKNDKSKFCQCDACRERPFMTQREYFEGVLRHEKKWNQIWQEENL